MEPLCHAERSEHLLALGVKSRSFGESLRMTQRVIAATACDEAFHKEGRDRIRNDHLSI